MITIQNYVRAQTLEEAYTLNQNRRNRIVGGMLWLKMGRGSVGTAIDLCELGLDSIEETADSFRIGATVTLRDLELHEGLNAYTNGAIRSAVRDIVGVQFRNMATVGGSVWGRFGFSDVLTVLMATDCYVELYKGGVMPLAQFAAQPYDRDLLLHIIIKKTPGRFAYTAQRNQRTDLPVITCAVSQWGGKVRAVVGARPSKAMLVTDEEGLLADGITAPSAAAFADYVAAHAPTGSNLRGSAAYRTQLIRVLIARTLNEWGGV